MSFIPYSCQSISEADIDAVTSVLRSDFLTQGPVITAFESAFAARHQTAHAIAVSNATAALHIACLALGIGPGNRVWTSPNSFLASANCGLYCGGTVDFVDIDPLTRNLSVSALATKLEEAKSTGTLPDLVIPVDFAGLPADLREVRVLADYYDFKVLEDASHATGATYLDKPVGSQYADAAVFSFHAVKIVTTAEGGMVTTNDPALAKRLRLLRSHGMTREAEQLEHEPDGPWYYEQVDLGFNYRLTDIQAALGLSQLTRMEAMQAARIEKANRYDSLLSDLPLQLPIRLPDRTSAWHLYAIELDPSRTKKSRLAVFQALREAQIGVNVHYIPIHTQPHYQRLGFKHGQFPAAENYYANAISIPLFPAMTDAQQDKVCAVLRGVLIKQLH